MAHHAQLTQHVIDEAKLLDAWLEGALQQVGRVPIPGRIGSGLLLRVQRMNDDERLRAAERFLGDIRAMLHRFQRTCEQLPEHIRTTLSNSGVGPDAFANLASDERLETGKWDEERERMGTRQEDVREVIEDARRRTELLVAELGRAFGYR